MNLDLTARELEMIRAMAAEASRTERKHGPAFERLVGRICDSLALENWRLAGYPQRETPATLKRAAKRGR